MVLDCAHGAASQAGPLALSDAGAEVIAINDRPDGLNINDNCGSTHLERIQEAVREHGADVGLDGDADRCLAVDHAGTVVDGDQALAVLALAMRDAAATMAPSSPTVMSNLGFVNAMKSHGIEVRQTKVGDRYVLEAMNAVGYGLGGRRRRSDRRSTAIPATASSPRCTSWRGWPRPIAAWPRFRRREHSRLPQVLVNVDGVDEVAPTRTRSSRPPSPRPRPRNRRDRPGPAASLRHRAPGAGDGPGRALPSRPARSRSGWPR